MYFQEKKKKEENIMSENSHVSNTKRKVKQEKGESKNEEKKRRETSRSSSSSFVVSLFRVRYLWCSHGVVFWQIELEFVDATFVGRSGGAYYHDVKVSGVLFAR